MTALSALATSISRALAFVGAAAVVVMMLHICADVVVRNLFNVSMNVTVDLVSRYYMTAIAFLPLGYLELRDEMVSVELLDAAFPRPLMRVSDTLVALIVSGLYVVLAWSTWPTAFSNLRSGTFVELVNIQLPVWHSYFIPPVGFTLAALATLIKAADLVLPGKRRA
ncbi:TRAP transporter small permease [Tranquillimonas alkanivorans]|uniref:TRAP transporter small permease protein n=1 Tax=Tranquillimonas alkanivorans TaxID=441119 RepID=A0A1I5Q1R9_9RHOB|nr:TRAP transporter small permease [Tranquillimonas alkanivorans]SFP40162.1 TRAP-type C4-dicarboxylate transport system, small permease component [Tranquillimonas alkanivorans]